MTAMLRNIRDLDARLKRGEITAEEFATRRAALLKAADVIETEYEAVTVPPQAPDKPRNAAPVSPNAIGFSIVVCLGVMGLSIALILALLQDLNLALTLGVTVLAALVVALFRTLDD